MNTDNDSFDPASEGGAKDFYPQGRDAQAATMVLMIGTGERGAVTLTLKLDIMEPGTKATGQGRFSLGLHTSLDKRTFAAGTLKSVVDDGRDVTIIQLTGWINPHEMADNWVNLRATIKLCKDRPELSMATLTYIAQEGSAPIALRNLPVSMSEMAML